MDAFWHHDRIKKLLKNTWNFNDFSSFGGRTWHQKSIKNQSKIEAQDEVPLSIDFGSILMDFEKQVGTENRAKIDQKSIQKGIEKMMKKEGILEGSGWENSRIADGHAGNPGPPKALKSKKNTKHQSQRQNTKGKGTPLHARRASAVADSFQKVPGQKIMNFSPSR